MHSIAIIGSGPTAIYTARYLLTRGEALSITLFESQAEAGKGTPYHQDWNDKQMLANIASIELPAIHDTLESWLQSNTDDALAKMGVVREEIHDRAFFPRVVLGEYFQAQLAALVEKALTVGCKIIVKTHHEVIDVKVAEHGIQLTVRDHGTSIHRPVFDYVVMATGHVWPKHTEIKPGYFLSPWPAHALRTIGHCHVGIRGTSLSAIDAAVALSVARGAFQRNTQGVLEYISEPGTDAFRMTMMSRKGVLPEADFFHPIPYLPLRLCTAEAVNQLIQLRPRASLLDDVFTLFKAELAEADPAYATKLALESLTLETFAHAYFHEREECDPFVWAEHNLAEAQQNQAQECTVAWRYAILRMHEVIARVVPELTAEDHDRFTRYFKSIFVDDYATVPHTSIERLLALHRAGKLEVMRVSDAYTLDTTQASQGATLISEDGEQIHFPAFIEAMGQRALSAHDFPFPTLWEQGIVQQATAPHFLYTSLGQRINKPVDIGGIALDAAYHPISDSPFASRLYCLSLPFMLSQFPFIQGITSSHDMGEAVALDIGKQMTTPMLPTALPMPLNHPATAIQLQ